MGEEEEHMEEVGATKEGSRNQGIMEVAAAAAAEEEVAVTMTVTTKMQDGIRREVEVAEAEEAGEEEAVAEEVDRGEDGELEGALILTKVDSLNSSSSRGGSTIIKLALIKGDITLVEDSRGTLQQSPHKKGTIYYLSININRPSRLC